MTTIKDLLWDTAVTSYGIAKRMDINDIKGVDSIVNFLKENESEAYSEYTEAELATEIEDELNQIVDENLDTIRERIVGF